MHLIVQVKQMVTYFNRNMISATRPIHQCSAQASILCNRPLDGTKQSLEMCTRWDRNICNFIITCESKKESLQVEGLFDSQVMSA